MEKKILLNNMKQKLKLVLPNKKYLKSYQNFCRDFIKNGKTEDYRKGYIKQLEVSKKSEFFKRLKQDGQDKNLPKGTVPQTQYWAIANNKVVGRVNLRHRLNKRMKEGVGHIGSAVRPSEQGKGYATEMVFQILKKAKKLGLKKVLRIADSDNIPSRKLIEKTGGVFKKEVAFEGVKVRHYWVTL